MDRLIFEFVVRSALIAAAAAAVLGVLRIRTAAAQHAIWTGVVVVMLALPIWIAWGPKAPLPVLPALDEPAVAMNAVPVSLAAPTIPASLEISEPASKPRVWSWDAMWIGVYLLGVGALLLRLAIGTVRANQLSSVSCAAPVTVGLLRPRVILPENWNEWPQAQLDAVMTHERAHARRRDPLVQWLALLNRALFWFHPVAWWLERRLAALAEEACDAAVLDQGHDPRDYSAYLLDLARAVQRAGMRVNVTGMAMPGSYLPQRIKKMIAGVSPSRVSRARMASAAVACVICSAMFAAGTLEHVAQIRLTPILPQAHAPSPLLAEPAPRPARVLRAQATATPKAAPQPATTTAPPKFEVASIRPCKDGDGRGVGRGGGGSGPSPGRLDLSCRPVTLLIQEAYNSYASGQTPPLFGMMPLPVPIEGGPDWINSALYQINAKAEGTPGRGMMRGPMLQALLEDRFKLRIHRQTREVPVYQLTVAKGGHKLKAAQEGGCIDGAPPSLESGQPLPRICGRFFGEYVFGTTMANLCLLLSKDISDRPIIDKTGTTGRFDIRLDPHPATLLSPDIEGFAPQNRAALNTAYFTAFQITLPKLGLKLERAKGPGEFLVIDHVERPSEN